VHVYVHTALALIGEILGSLEFPLLTDSRFDGYVALTNQEAGTKERSSIAR